MTTEDDEITKVYPRAWARAIAAISLEDPEMWPDLEPALEPALEPVPEVPEPEGAYTCDAFFGIFGMTREK